MMKKWILALFVLFYSTLSFGRNPSCFEIIQLVHAAGAFHVNSPKINEQLIKDAARNYIAMLDPYQYYLTNIEYNSLVKKFDKSPKKYLALFYDDTCSVFEDIEKTIKKGEKRIGKALDKAIAKGPLKKEVKKKVPFHLNDKTLNNFLVNRYRNDLYKNRDDLKGFSEYLKTKNNMFERLGDRKNTVIVKAFYQSIDPHSSYFTSNEWNAFETSVSASMVGFGIRYRIDYQGALIEDIIPDSPMAKSNKIEAGDRILKINEIDMRGEDDFSKLQITAGVEFNILAKKKSGEIIEFKVITEKFSDDKVKVSSKISKIHDKKILVLQVPSFYYNEETQKGTSEDIYEQYLNNLDQGIDAIVLDLRNNLGGLVEQAQRVTGLFVGDKVVLYTRDRDGKTEEGRSPFVKKTPLITKPLIVLENKASASASEIVAGALKVYGRALLVGDTKSYGKGTVQYVFPHGLSENLGVIKITVSQFYLPNGESTQKVGVSPHIVIPSIVQDFPGEETLKNALPFHTIPSEIKTKELEVDIKELTALSEKRVKDPKKFKKDQEDSKEDMVLNETLNISLDFLSAKETKDVGSQSR